MRIDSRREAVEHLDRMEAEAARFEPRLGDRHTAWRRWGEVGPAVVLLNGGTGSWMHWVRNIPALKDRYRVFAADLPGMGDSGLPPVTEPVEDLVRISGTIVASGIEGLLGRDEPVHVVGFSFGSMVGAHAVARLGTQVETFTMAGASGLGLAFAGPGRLRKPEPGMSGEALREVHRYNMTTLLFADPANADELALEMQVRNAGKVRIRSHTSAVTSILLEALPGIRARLGAIWGGLDPFLPERAEREALLRRFDPDTPIHIVPEAGHWVPYEGAEAFNRHLLDLLARGNGPPGSPSSRPAGVFGGRAR